MEPGRTSSREIIDSAGQHFWEGQEHERYRDLAVSLLAALETEDDYARRVALVASVFLEFHRRRY